MRYLILIITFTSFFSNAQNRKNISFVDRLAKKEFVDKINVVLSQNSFSYNNLNTTLNSFGYFDYNITKIDSTDNNISIYGNLGKPSEHIIIKVDETQKLPKNILTLLDKKARLKTSNIKSYLTKLSQSISKLGYPFNIVKLIQIEKDANTNLSALININLNKKKSITKVIVKGYPKFPKSFIKHYLNIKTQQYVNIEDLNTKTNKTKNLQFVEEIKPPEILFTKDSTNVYIFLKKKNANNFDGFVGFNSQENSKKLEFNGYLNLNLVNNLNAGERLSVIYKSDETKQKNFKTVLEIPYFFKTPVGAEASLQIFNRDSSFTNTTTQIKAIYTTTKNYNLKIGYESKTSVLANNDASNNLSAFNASFVTSEFNYSIFDTASLLNIIKTNLSINSKVGTRKTSKEKNNQTSFFIQAKNRFKLNKKNAIELKSKTFIINSKNYFTNELNRFGGINTIRGFNENSIEASMYAIFNIEYHYLLNKTLAINTITDFGYFENNVLNQKKRLYSLGLGLSALTKGGLLKLTLANGSLEDAKQKFRNTNLHVSLIAFF